MRKEGGRGRRKERRIKGRREGGTEGREGGGREKEREGWQSQVVASVKFIFTVNKHHHVPTASLLPAKGCSLLYQQL